MKYLKKLFSNWTLTLISIGTVAEANGVPIISTIASITGLEDAVVKGLASTAIIVGAGTAVGMGAKFGVNKGEFRKK